MAFFFLQYFFQRKVFFSSDVFSLSFFCVQKIKGYFLFFNKCLCCALLLFQKKIFEKKIFQKVVFFSRIFFFFRRFSLLSLDQMDRKFVKEVSHKVVKKPKHCTMRLCTSKEEL